METKIIAEFKNEEEQTAGIVACWMDNGKEVFSASLRDLDSGLTVPYHILWIDQPLGREKAIAAAKKMANV